MQDDPAAPDFWNRRYAAGRMPWDQQGVPPALARFLARRPGAGAKVLIPGCGSGYEIAAFAAAGHDVTAIDFSPAAVARAKAVVGPELAGRVREGDYFTAPLPAAQFDLVYERTFVCALAAESWPKIAARTAALLRPAGTLAGVYYFGPKEDGPPFGLSVGEERQLFGQCFQLIADEPVPVAESLPLFAGRERWQEWRRLP